MTEPIVDARILQKVGLEQGYKNPDDIYELPTKHAITEEELLLGSETDKHLIEVKIDGDALTENEKLLFREIKRFVHEMSEDVELEFVGTYRDMQKTREELTDTILEFLQQKKLTKPRFIIADKAYGEDLLQRLKLEYPEVQDEASVVVFNLPKPISEYWWKTINDLSGISVGKEIVPWGEFYHAVMPEVWKALGYEQMEGTIELTRINDVGQHDPENYYYVWIAELADTVLKRHKTKNNYTSLWK